MNVPGIVFSYTSYIYSVCVDNVLWLIYAVIRRVVGYKSQRLRNNFAIRAARSSRIRRAARYFADDQRWRDYVDLILRVEREILLSEANNNAGALAAAAAKEYLYARGRVFEPVRINHQSVSAARAFFSRANQPTLFLTSFPSPRALPPRLFFSLALFFFDTLAQLRRRAIFHELSLSLEIFKNEQIISDRARAQRA